MVKPGTPQLSLVDYLFDRAVVQIQFGNLPIRNLDPPRDQKDTSLEIIGVSQVLPFVSYAVRKELVGELNSQVARWLNKGFTVKFTVSVSVVCFFPLSFRFLSHRRPRHVSGVSPRSSES